MLNGKTIVLGVSGGIAVYKAAALTSRLAQSGAEVHVIMTESAAKFVTPLTFQTLSRQPVHTDTFAERDASVVAHIDLADRADLFVVAPATANIIAKMACGLADDMLSTTLLATTAPILVAPAMNVHMYEHPAVQANMQTLRERGVHFIEPGVGQLACGYVGRGRLAEPEDIYAEIVRLMTPDQTLAGRKVLITAGGTLERIDPVRFITNDSSGKMGYAAAQAAQEMGAEVTLVSANVSLPAPRGVKLVPVVSTRDMYEAVMERLDAQDLIIKAAAVADYRPAAQSAQKIKKSEEQMTLVLEKTEDILAEIGRRKKGQFVIGFAAETEHLEEHAMKKVRSKGCDLIAANDVSQQGIGFGADHNELYIFDQNGLVKKIPRSSKLEAARELLRLAAERMNAKGNAAP
ncbi:putative coenzyme A biosynthesis bifunctional protein CoaBC [Insulibacter thermoxylanivorax]|uniref:Coenzyme A biosynthesis bifunctional protein CoaBC n=1 Tax=Insulibacter thermoxylanivorax TaxID=2749268 RepID=A0A916QFY2_9BACL|nr:bifunctional phosphopantothenoylcysteine decarboxylase/phosphopantothenate--cysteine ligase CoaBC [Insulibacter thermoxylanivorax]GFR37801.1 putative coenzyme A biosynthesis bifunctional protein CoaBC [Insulibacter thermoxylanivorax]